MGYKNMIKNNAGDIHTTEEAPCVVHHSNGDLCEAEDVVIAEHFMEISVNGKPLARLSCTPDKLSELVIGRLYTERVIDSVEDIEKLFICGQGELAEVTLKKDIEFVEWNEAEPTCCTGNKQYLSSGCKRKLEPITETVPKPEYVFELIKYFQNDSKLHVSTGGTHSAYIRTIAGDIFSFEDISRHNALDKAVGHILINGLNPKECMLYTSGRIAADMAIKAIAAGIPVLVSKAVPTSEALKLAKQYKLSIIGKAWPDSYVRYLSKSGDEKTSST